MSQQQKPKMNVIEAFNVVAQASGQATLKRAEHEMVTSALESLKELIEGLIKAEQEANKVTPIKADDAPAAEAAQ